MSRSNSTFRVLGVVAGTIFIAMTPVLFFGLEGSYKTVVIPVAGFGILFLVSSIRRK